MRAPHWSMSTRLVCWTAASPADTEARLGAAVDRGDLSGTIGDGSFALVRPRRGRNSWRPRLNGRIRPHAGGTAITVEIDAHPFVLVFTAFHAIFFLGLTWLMGVFAFSREADAAVEALVEALGATVRGEDEVMALHRAGDPSEPGAETSAPLSLGARATTDRVVFHLVGFDRARLPPVELEVDAVGIRVSARGEPIRPEVRWHDIARCRSVDGSGVVEVIAADGAVLGSIPCAGHRPADVAWLTAWLDAQAARRRISPEDDERQRREHQRLGRLVRDVDR